MTFCCGRKFFRIGIILRVWIFDNFWMTFFFQVAELIATVKVSNLGHARYS